jgi:hypothetical protein
VTVKFPKPVGVPVIAPVEELIDAHAGNPVAAHEIAGRFVASVSENVFENAVPKALEADCPAVMIGLPPVIGMENGAVSEPPELVAVK